TKQDIQICSLYSILSLLICMMACTTITSSGDSNPATTTITHETSAFHRTNFEKREFKILWEISPKVFRISGGPQVNLDYLETSLAGTVFLVEYNGQYRKL
ncbi:hypothetical protein B0O99DRAFT_645282, partial [Bisporella sp. PMI_857]